MRRCVLASRRQPSPGATPTAHRTGGTLVLAFVDVDGLKQVNDHDGHLAGDALLKLVGSAHVRQSGAFGIAESERGDGLQELLARADAALLEARRGGAS